MVEDKKQEENWKIPWDHSKDVYLNEEESKRFLDLLGPDFQFRAAKLGVEDYEM